MSAKKGAATAKKLATQNSKKSLKMQKKFAMRSVKLPHVNYCIITL